MRAEELIKQLDDSRAETERQLKGLDPEKVVYEESGWRVRDIITHLTAWEEAVTSSIQAWHWGEEFTLDDDMSDDEINERQFERRRNFKLARVWEDWKSARDYLKRLIRETPKDKLDGVELMCPWRKTSTLPNLVKDMIEHEQEHLQDVMKVVGE